MEIARKSFAERKEQLTIDEQISFEIDHLYISLDVNGEGKINEAALYRALFAAKKGHITHEEVNNILNVLDVNHDGYIDRDEFKNYMLDQIKNDILNAEDTMEDLRMKFNQFDIDGNGWLSTSEFL